jgi:hypothetical protein
MGNTKSLASGLLVTSLLLAACGGDAEESTATQPAAGTAAVPSATAERAPGTAAPTDATDATDATDSTAAPAPAVDSIVTECPDVAEIAPIYGSELTFDDANATSGAIGLLFCPYTEVVAPGTTNNFGLEPIPEEFSLTFTNQNIAVDDGGGGEEVPGLGEAALWNEFTGLSVWTGQQGLIVSIVFPPPGGDAKTVAIAIAQHVLA